MAGEIQLNSTTMATESSGSITAQLDTIRPNTTNGSLTLQGDSSDAGVTGLTIDSSGNATFAQTISGGTIGSSVVFPAGHILQTTQNTYNSADSAVTTSATPTKVVDGSGNNYWSHTISGMTAGNDVLVHMSFVASSNRSSSPAATGSAFHIYRDSSLIYTSTDDFMFHIDLNPTGSSVSIWTYVNLIFLDTGASSTSHTYYAGYSSWSSSSTQVRSSSARSPFVCILQEIKA